MADHDCNTSRRRLAFQVPIVTSSALIALIASALPLVERTPFFWTSRHDVDAWWTFIASRNCGLVRTFAECSDCRPAPVLAAPRGRDRDRLRRSKPGKSRSIGRRATGRTGQIMPFPSRLSAKPALGIQGECVLDRRRICLTCCQRSAEELLAMHCTKPPRRDTRRLGGRDMFHYRRSS